MKCEGYWRLSQDEPDLYMVELSLADVQRILIADVYKNTSLYYAVKDEYEKYHPPEEDHHD